MRDGRGYVQPGAAIHFANTRLMCCMVRQWIPIRPVAALRCGLNPQATYLSPCQHPQAGLLGCA